MLTKAMVMKRILSSLFLFGLTSALAVPNAVALEGETLEELRAVQLYDQDKLIEMIDANTHLNKVVEDRCQLVQDIEARADVLKVPAYQFLWGDMLAWGVWVDAEPARGISYMEDAANQGFPAALEQLGRYYAKGTLVQQDKSRAVVYLREASSLQNLNYVTAHNLTYGIPIVYGIYGLAYNTNIVSQAPDSWEVF